MRVVVQRVKKARVEIAGETVGKIDQGLLLLVGLAFGDNEAIVAQAAQKIAKLRIFADAAGKTNLSLADIQGKILSVSQFTLLANTKKGNRPSFVDALKPPRSEELWQTFNEDLRRQGLVVETGHFGADMAVSLVNDGPFTLVLDY